MCICTYMHVHSQKNLVLQLLFATGRAALVNTLFYLLGKIFKFFDKGRTIDFVIYMTGFLFTVQNSAFVQQVQMPGNNRSVLGHVFGNGADVGSSVDHQKLQYLQPHRLAHGFKKFQIKVFGQFIQDFYGFRLRFHAHTLMHTNAHVKKNI